MYFVSRARALCSLCYVTVLLLNLCFALNNAQAQDVKIYPIEANKAGILIQSFTEREVPTLVFIYTSWCSVCRENFPYVLKIARQYKDKGFNVLALSMDRDESALKQYLVSHGDIPFTPYLIKQRYSGDFTAALKRVGIRYRNSIPYTIIYGRKGKVLGQGNIKVSSLEPVIAELINVNTTQDSRQGGN